jgi:SUMO ligase MMS21 Smc5/6 complex component
MSDNRTLYVEEAITGAVKRLLAGRVNEILMDAEFPVPPVEFGDLSSGSAVCPQIVLSTCERTEKERIIRLDAYTVTISFALPESEDTEQCCYAYAAAVEKTIAENTALGGVVDRAVLTGKKYTAPKHAGTGEGWGLALIIRITVEGMSNAG